MVAQNASGALAMALRLASCVALTEQWQASLASRLVIDPPEAAPFERS